jgi:hypothetical protein
MALLVTTAPAAAQELQPRALQNAPVGMNFAWLAVGYSRGNVLFDPTLPITDANADVWSATLGFARAISVFGLSGRIGATVPAVTGNWSGTVGGLDTSTARTGLADPRLLVAVNFLGAPALSLREFAGYRHTTVAGFQLQIMLPLGQYDPARLINLGSHRWGVAPRLGISQALGRRWLVEGYAGATFFTTNDEFYGGTVLSQEPFFEAQADVVFAIRVPDIWLAVSAGHGWGGAATVDGEAKEPLQNSRVSAVLHLPLARGHGLKLVYVNGLTTKLGADFDTFQVAYQYTFGGRS